MTGHDVQTFNKQAILAWLNSDYAASLAFITTGRYHDLIVSANSKSHC